ARALRSASIRTVASTAVPSGTSSSTPGASARYEMPSASSSARRAGEVEARTRRTAGARLSHVPGGTDAIFVTHPAGLDPPPFDQGSVRFSLREPGKARGRALALRDDTMDPRPGSRSRHRRGATLLLSLGVITFLTLGAITTLNLITAQSDPAGQD